MPGPAAYAAPRVAALPTVELRRDGAFALPPEPVDWLFSDVICYPQRLLALVERWLPLARNIFCSVKFQGATDMAAIAPLAEVPGSSLRHLFNNKHELTWMRLA